MGLKYDKLHASGARKTTEKIGGIPLGLPQMLDIFREAEAPYLLDLWLFISVRVTKDSCHKIGRVTG